MLRPSVKIDFIGVWRILSAARRLSSLAAAVRLAPKFAIALSISAPGGFLSSRIQNRRCTPFWKSSPPSRAAQRYEGRIADIRDRDRVFSLIKPRSSRTWCFAAAALKHVPILERDWDEGIKTNVFGSVNVADAALNAGADAMVMISTDKAIEPVSVLGATKRLAEMYCQGLDAGKGSGRGGRVNGGKPADAHDRGALRQRARLERLGGAEIQGADRAARRSRHRDRSEYGPLLYDYSRSSATSPPRRQAMRSARRARRPRFMSSTWVSRSRS